MSEEVIKNSEATISETNARIRRVILRLRSQVKNPSILDQFLSNLTRLTAIDGRLPFSPKKVVTVANKTMCLHNEVAYAILQWGAEARNESPSVQNDHLALLEKIAESGFKIWGAYPKDRNSAIHVLRTVTEEKALRDSRATAQEKALERKANHREAELSGKVPPAVVPGTVTPAVVPVTGLEQEESDEE